MCSFSINFSQDVQLMIDNVNVSIQKIDQAFFEGTVSLGSFSLPSPLGVIKGSYIIKNNTALFTIQEKPMLVPCSMIESKLNTLLNPHV